MEGEMNKHDAKIILKDILRKADTQISRWEKFKAYEHAGTRPAPWRYGEQRMNKTISRWTAQRDALMLAINLIDKTV